MGAQKSLPQKSTTTKLSLVTSFYKDDRRALNTIRKINSALKESGITYELIAIFNGGYLKTTIDLLRNKPYPNTKIIAYRGHRSHGFAVKYGMLNAVGEYIGFVDNKLTNDQLNETIGAITQQLILRNKDLITITQNNGNRFNNFILTLVQNILLGFYLEKPGQVATLYKKSILYDVLTRSALDDIHWETELFAIAKSLNKLKQSEQSIENTNISSKISIKQLLHILKNIYFNGYYQKQTINKFNEITLKYAQLRVSEIIATSQSDKNQVDLDK